MSHRMRSRSPAPFSAFRRRRPESPAARPPAADLPPTVEELQKRFGRLVRTSSHAQLRKMLAGVLAEPARTRVAEVMDSPEALALTAVASASRGEVTLFDLATTPYDDSPLRALLEEARVPLSTDQARALWKWTAGRLASDVLGASPPRTR